MKTQIDILADFIMANVEGEPSKSEGAGDCAIRIITELEAELAEERETFPYTVKLMSEDEWFRKCSPKNYERLKQLEAENVRLRGHCMSALKYAVHIDSADAPPVVSHLNLALAETQEKEVADE